MRSRVVRAGLISVLIGLFLLAIGISLDPLLASLPRMLGEIAHHLLRDIGIGFIILGVFNFMLSHSDWQGYFEDRLRGIVVEQSYLDRLEKVELKRLVRAAIKAQAPGAAIDREGGFLEYFEDHLHRFIVEPYRENATAEIIFREVEEGKDVLEVIDKFSYTARSVGGVVQSRVYFELDPGESMNGGEVTMSIKLPERSSDPGKVELLADREQMRDNGSGGFTIVKEIPPEYVGSDRLEVAVEAVYQASRERVQTWWMSTPTRDLRCIVSFPRDYAIQIKEFVQAPQLADWTRRPGYLMFRYPSWILPGNGIVWDFRRESPVQPEK